ncbi:hypothetical protein OIE43_44340 [Streptomyces pseudovenezuelae]|uniref:hypothetical protein n=1 Tax=Streptomyces pseudovenezuelae TaxID=67350 RepID=UPI002E34AFA8|nr:hypothetical protein [Streptomyces pseudovenezuelae]
MQGDVADEQSAAAPARDLQPPAPVGKSDFTVPVSEDDLRRVDAQYEEEARELQANVDRRLRDRQLLLVLAHHGFRGPKYDHFVQELVRYGVSVLRAWMHSGCIFGFVADRGFGLSPHELELEELASDSDLREDLAMMTVARALPPFRQRALVEGRWTYEGGASITTYFMGACLYVFPNEFRRHRASRERQRRLLLRQQETALPFPAAAAGHLRRSGRPLQRRRRGGEQAVRACEAEGHQRRTDPSGGGLDPGWPHAGRDQGASQRGVDPGH